MPCSECSTRASEVNFPASEIKPGTKTPKHVEKKEQTLSTCSQHFLLTSHEFKIRFSQPYRIFYDDEFVGVFGQKYR